MHYNPCGLALDWGRHPYTTLARLHASEDAPLVRLRWYVTELPFLQVPETVINSRYFDDAPEQWLSVGEVPDWYARRYYNARWYAPPGLNGNHVCKSEWFATGEPWPVSLPPTVYDDEWIPECCERLMPCTTEECKQDPVGGQAASQHYQYPIAQVDIVPETPRLFQEVAKNEGDDSPALPGFRREFLPVGETASWSFREMHFTNADGTLVQDTRTVAINGSDYAQQVVTPTLFAFALSIGGSTGTLALTMSGGVLQIGGTNARVSETILPQGSRPATFGQPTPAGTTVFDATPLDATDNVLGAQAGGGGIKIPATTFGVWSMVSVLNPDFTNVARFYAGDSGAQFYIAGGGPNADFIDIDPGWIIVVRQTNPGRFTVLAHYQYA